jgi:putative phage-type endonuclease
MTAALNISQPYEVICDVADSRDEWLRHRFSGIGASEIACVFGCGFMSALQLYQQKVGRFERDMPGDERIYWGNKLEDDIIEAYAERTERRTRKAGKLLRSIEHPWAVCTLDGETWHPSAPNDVWPFEAKNAGAYNAGDWVDGAPDYYYYQLQQQILVTGASKATIAALLGGQRMVWCDVPRDDECIRKIVYFGSRFWERIQNQDMPDPDGSESSKRALAKLYPTGSGIIVFGRKEMDAADEIERLKAELKERKERIDLLENQIRASIADNEIGAMPDGRSFSLKLQRRKEFTTPETSFRVLRLHQPKGT